MIGIGVCIIDPVICQIGGARCMPMRCERSIIDLVQRERTATKQRSCLANLIRNLWIDWQIRHTTKPSLIIRIIFTVAGKISSGNREIKCHDNELRKKNYKNVEQNNKKQLSKIAGFEE